MLLSAAVGARGRVYATDIQPEMLALIREKVEKRRLSNVELVQGTATESRLPDLWAAYQKRMAQVSAGQTKKKGRAS